MPEPDLSQVGAATELDPRTGSVEAVRAREESPAQASGDGEIPEWLDLAEARRVLGVISEAVVAYWAGAGWLRSRMAPDGRMEVLQADVVREKAIREGLGAMGGDEMPPDELDGADRDPEYRPPWAWNAVAPSVEGMDEWLDPAEAQRELGLALEEYVEYWAKMGWLRSRPGPDGRLEVLRADVLSQKAMREGLGAIGGEELTPEELDELEAARPGTLPWKRAEADRPR